MADARGGHAIEGGVLAQAQLHQTIFIQGAEAIFQVEPAPPDLRQVRHDARFDAATARAQLGQPAPQALIGNVIQVPKSPGFHARKLTCDFPSSQPTHAERSLPRTRANAFSLDARRQRAIAGHGESISMRLAPSARGAPKIVSMAIFVELFFRGRKTRSVGVAHCPDNALQARRHGEDARVGHASRTSPH